MEINPWKPLRESEFKQWQIEERLTSRSVQDAVSRVASHPARNGERSELETYLKTVGWRFRRSSRRLFAKKN